MPGGSGFIKMRILGIASRTNHAVLSARSFCLIILCAASISMPQNSWAGPTECQDAIAEYKSAMSEVSTALHTYSDCLSIDDGHDDCSTEFESLKSAHEDLESAVSSYGSECN
jgi:hypothetical protein